jgi:hypothetical protein
MEKLVLAISAEHADALLDGSRDSDHRTLPPARLPAKAYLAVVGTATVVGECVLGERAGRTKAGWKLPVTNARRYKTVKPVSAFGLTRIPRSFRYVDTEKDSVGRGAGSAATMSPADRSVRPGRRIAPRANSPASRRT